MSKKTIVFPGSFDPFTNGHFDVAKRALEIFDNLIISVVHNPSKESLFTLDERCEIIEKVFEGISEKVVVKSFSGLLVNHLKDLSASVILRGLRAISDFDYEAQMALVNMHLGGDDVETVFMMAREENSYISSTLIKQIAPYGGDVSKLVPAVVKDALLEKIESKK